MSYREAVFRSVAAMYLTLVWCDSVGIEHFLFRMSLLSAASVLASSEFIWR